MLIDSFNFSIQLLLALAIPALIALVVVGVLSGFIENLLGLKGAGLKYGFKLVAAICLVYLFSSTAVSQIQGQIVHLLSK